MQNDRPLPAAVPDEMVIIACCTNRQSVETALSCGLLPNHFYDHSNKIVFAKCVELLTRNKPIDFTLIYSELREEKRLTDEQISALIDRNVAPCVDENIHHFAEKIIKAWQRRRLIEIAEIGYDEETPIEKISERLQDALSYSEKQTFPDPVSGVHYIENGIPPLKDELIEGILRRSHSLIIGAASKAAKSFLLYRLAFAIAHGRPWLAYQCRQGNVMVCNFELDEASYINRGDKILNEEGWEKPRNIFYYHLKGKVCEIEKLLPSIAKACEGMNISAIIFDPQYAMFSSLKYPDFGENNTAAMRYFYTTVARYFSDQNISPIFVGHFAKGTAGQKEQIDRVSGSGIMARFVDAFGTMTELETKNCYRIEWSLREFATPEPLSVRWQYPLHHIDGMLDSVPLKTRPGRQAANTVGDDEIVLNKVRELNGSATQSAVRAALSGRIGKQRVFDSLQRLSLSGKLTVSKGGKNAILYQSI